ncbi:fasciclin-2 isoform X4 [Nasonia vitripennis]|uniref:Fasciclin-2 n=1 Tax=Nasonia vitripennis TaxID=7425 RepID=A0A7M7QP87_NASVI|nr:fasciclin-2 isoform X4 [Nasonia vitripennis]
MQESSSLKTDAADGSSLCISLLCVYVFGAARNSTIPTQAEAQKMDQYMEILPSGEKQTKPVGSSILMTCKPRVADTKLITDIQWIDPQNRAIESLKLVVLPLDSNSPGYSKPPMYTELHPQDNSISLFFNSLQEDQAGQYICRGTYANTELLSKTVIIETIVAITWDDAPLNQFPILGEDFAIKCQVRARPSPKVDWLFNGEVIRTNDHYVIETHALRIKNVKESDDGIYTCRASVEQTGELQERAIRVEVHTRPSIVEAENSVYEVTEGESAQILCKGTGKPPPKFTWIKTLTKENLAVTDRFSVNEDTGLLTISNVKRDDSGEYQCTATNAAGMAIMNIQVNVIVKPKIMEFLNQTIAQGEKTVLSCKAFGKPPPTITFRKHTSEKPFIRGVQPEDDRIHLTNDFDDQQGETVGNLTIDHTLRSDDGLYECIANNKGGMAFKNGHLTVEFPPSFASMSNRTIYSWDNRPVNLTCIAESIPNATIHWTYYGNDKVENDQQITVYDNGPISSLYIKPLDRRYYTQYKCHAKNRLGEAIHVMELREAPKPADIPQVSMIDTTATTITFNIVPPVAPVDLPIRTISVQYKVQNQPWTMSKNRTWAVGSRAGYVIENLEPQTTYEFRFAASNEAGRGNWAQHKNFATTMRSVPGRVKFLPRPGPNDEYIKSPFHDRYNLKWTQAPDNGERIDYYEVKWCEVKKYSGDEWVEQGNCQQKTEIKQETWVTELYPDTYYKIGVKAHNFLGLGEAQNITIKTTRGNASNASVLQHHGSIISSAAIIGIVIAVLIVIMLITDAILCCTNKSGIIYYMCERSRRKPVDEEDAKLGSLYGWRFPLPYCDQKMANVAGVTAIQDSGSGKSTITLVKHTAIDEKEPLKEEKKITPIIDSGLHRESSVTFDGKRSISKTGFVGKDSAV